jgi:FKBP-type peptidyl-prolyl cis-trans isomerase FkpA
MQASIYRNIVSVLLLVFATTGCGQQPAEGEVNEQADSTEQAAAGGEAQVAASEATKDEAVEITELQIIEVVEGDGVEAQAGQEVVVHYTGWLYEPGADGDKGQKFDSSVDRGDPFVFPLGGGRVIRGWDEGVAGMQVGGKRTLIIPPDMAYGDRGAGAVIPPGAILVFDVELLEIQ